MFTNHWSVSGLLALAIILPAHTDAWEATLKHGESVQVDPQTHKPAINYGGSNTQLWNGVHKLEDGSTIIVRDGVAVPNETMYQAWSQPVSAKTAPNFSECEQLTRRVCGINQGCINSEACGLAQQLKRLWEDAPDSVPIGISPTGQIECHKGLLDQVAFPPCVRDAQAPSSCARLVTRVCGDKSQCQATPACDAARQLLKLAQETHLSSPDAADGEQLKTQCQDALANTFFAACQVNLLPKAD